MRPSRWRSYWVVRAPEHDRLTEKINLGQIDYGPFPLNSFEDEVEDDSYDGW